MRVAVFDTSMTYALELIEATQEVEVMMPNGKMEYLPVRVSFSNVVNRMLYYVVIRTPTDREYVQAMLDYGYPAYRGKSLSADETDDTE